jgi:hypothetical protein
VRLIPARVFPIRPATSLVVVFLVMLDRVERHELARRPVADAMFRDPGFEGRVAAEALRLEGGAEDRERDGAEARQRERDRVDLIEHLARISDGEFVIEDSGKIRRGSEIKARDGGEITAAEPIGPNREYGRAPAFG